VDTSHGPEHDKFFVFLGLCHATVRNLGEKRDNMELSDEPKSWVEEARNRVKRISDLDPKDRLDIVYGIGLCCSTLAKSMQGWMQWIGNLSLKDFEQQELEEIFGIIKKATVQLMELDIDKTSKYEESHGLRQKPTRETNRLVS
jgi:hypothetical protein